MSFDRRSFLSMMAALPFTANAEKYLQAACGTEKAQSKTTDLYVWVHGIFGITYQEDGIVLVSPDLSTPRNKHLHKIGRVTAYSKGRFEGVQDFMPGDYKVVISGYTPGHLPPVDTRDVLFLKGSLLPYYSGQYYFRFPLPTAILPVRFMQAAVNGPSDPANPVGGLSPFAHVLKFPNVPISNVKVERNSSDKKQIRLWEETVGQHLHFFIEQDPQCPDGDPCHSYQGSLAALLDCYQTKSSFVLSGDGSCAAPLDNILSFADCLKEQLFLSEWAGKCEVQFYEGQPGPVYAETFAGHQCPHLLVADPNIFDSIRPARTERKKERVG